MRIGDTLVRVVLRVVRILAMSVLPEISFIYRFVKETLLPKHSNLYSNCALLLIFATVVNTESEQDPESQEDDNVEEVTIVEDIYADPRPLRGAR